MIRAEPPRKTSWLLLAAGITAIVVGLIALVAFFGLPVSTMHSILRLSTGCSVTLESDPNRVIKQSPGCSFTRKLINNYARHALIAELNERLPKVPASYDDVQKMRYYLHTIAELLVSQADFDAVPPNCALFTLGFGYCDQVNGAAAILLSHHFKKSEVYSLRYPNGVSPHTIGRVWSDQRREWLYYDIWPMDKLIFTYNGGTITILDHDTRFMDPNRMSTEEKPTASSSMQEVYRLIDRGFVLIEHEPSFDQYVLHRIRWYVARFADRILSNSASANAAGRSEGDSQAPLAKEFSVPCSFLDARIAHVLGDRQKAEELYKSAQKSLSNGQASGESLLVRNVADIFVKRIQSASAARSS